MTPSPEAIAAAAEAGSTSTGTRHAYYLKILEAAYAADAGLAKLVAETERLREALAEIGKRVASILANETGLTETGIALLEHCAHFAATEPKE